MKPLQSALTLTLISLPLTLSFTARLQNASTKDSTVQELIQRIKDGNDPNALLEAGRTGNPVFILYLREHLHQDAYKHSSLKWEAQMALAKLNQADQLQAVYCQLATGNESVVADTMTEFEYVGGWFSVRLLNSVLSGDLAANPPVNPQAAPDVQFVPSKLVAASALEKLFPSAGHERTPDNPSSFWTNYISAHEQHLKKLQPTGDGVDFSDKACKNGKPRKKH